MKMTYLSFLLLLTLALSGCTAANNEWLGRQLSGLDCRPDKLDVAGRCVPTR